MGCGISILKDQIIEDLIESDARKDKIIEELKTQIDKEFRSL